MSAERQRASNFEVRASLAERYNERGDMAFERKEFTRALENYIEAVEKDPNKMASHLNCAETHLKLKNFVESIRCYEKAISIGKKTQEDSKVIAGCFAKLGNVYRVSAKKKEFTKALKNYAKAIEMDPNEITYYLKCGEIHFEVKDFLESIKFYEKAINVGQEVQAGSKLIAKCFEKLKTAHRENGTKFDVKKFESKTADITSKVEEMAAEKPTEKPMVSQSLLKSTI